MACAFSSCSAWENRSMATQVGSGAAVTEHQDLRGSGNHVDADTPEHLALRLGHINVARTDDLVHRGYSSSTQSERRNCLGATDGEHPVHAGDGPPQPAPGRLTPRRVPGTTMTISSTPATRAGSAFISTEDG